jgi:hypothetical protein
MIWFIDWLPSFIFGYQLLPFIDAMSGFECMSSTMEKRVLDRYGRTHVCIILYTQGYYLEDKFVVIDMWNEGIIYSLGYHGHDGNVSD